MAVILSKTISTYGNPYAYYMVEATSTSERTANSVKVTLKITSNLKSAESSLGTGYTLKAYFAASGSGWSSAISVKGSSDVWRGTTAHTKTATVTISGLSSTQTKLTNVKFKVESNARDKACQLNTTSCSNITISSYHQNPVFSVNNVTFTEMNQSVINAQLSSNTYVLNLSQVKTQVSGVQYYDDAEFSKLYLLSQTNSNAYEVIQQLTTNPSTFTPIKAFANNNVYFKLFDNEGGEVFLTTSYKIFNTIPYISVTLNSTVRRVGQTSGQVSISCSGNYYNGTIGNRNQGGTYKPTIKYKFWRYGTTEPQTYDYTVNANNITISNGTYSVSSLNIGSTTETATNYFNPKYAYRVKIQVNDNFMTQSSGEISIPVGEATWTEYADRVDFKKITIQGVEVTPGGGGGGDYEQCINKPSINSVTLSGDKTASQLGFASVATSGNYNDLTNKPTIPTVNNGTLTIQKNGTNVQTFTANASSNVTANITVPTKTSDLTNDGDGTLGYKYINDVGTYEYYSGDYELKGLGVYDDDRIYFQTTHNNSYYNEPLANLSDIPYKTSQLTNDSNYITSSGSITGNAATATSLKPICVVGSDVANTSGWYKVADCTMSGWGNQNILYYVKGGYTNGYVGLLDLEMRSDNTSISCWKCRWLVRHPNMTENSVKIVISGMKWTMYAYNPSSRYGRIYFTELTNRNIQGNAPDYTIYYHNTTVPEETEPSAHYVSQDAGIVERAKCDKNGNDITTTYQPTLVSGTNIKTINNASILGSGNITIGGGGTSTDVQVNGTSITSGGVANLVTQSAYNSSTNKIATKNDIPTVNNATLTIQKNGTTVNTFTANASSNVTANITVPTNTNQLTNDAGFITSSYHDSSKQDTLSVTTGTNAVTKTSGNATIRESDYYQYGKVVEMRLVLDTTASTSAGSNLFQGTIKSALKPMDYVTGVGFNGGTIQVGQISPEGEVTVRNLIGSLGSNKATGIHFTYLIS